jgi:hypothetical protein
MKFRSSTLAHLFLIGNAAALWTPAALADDCPAPTADQCSDKTYLDTSCGRAQLSTPNSTCSDLHAASYQARSSALPASAVHETMPPGRPGDVVIVGSPTYSFDAHRAHGIDTQLLGTMQRTVGGERTGSGQRRSDAGRSHAARREPAGMAKQ